MRHSCPLASKAKKLDVTKLSVPVIEKQCDNSLPKIKSRRQPTMHELKELVHHSL